MLWCYTSFIPSICSVHIKFIQSLVNSAFITFWPTFIKLFLDMNQNIQLNVKKKRKTKLLELFVVLCVNRRQHFITRFPTIRIHYMLLQKHSPHESQFEVRNYIALVLCYLHRKFICFYGPQYHVLLSLQVDIKSYYIIIFS